MRRIGIVLGHRLRDRHRPAGQHRQRDGRHLHRPGDHRRGPEGRADPGHERRQRTGHAHL